MSTLYERIGGEAAVMAAVDLFYKKVLADDRVSEFFTGLDMEAQVRKQVSFMTVAFGGPDEYRGRDMREAHKQLVAERGLNDSHFDAVAENLQSTLSELGVASDLIDEAMALVGGTRDEVLNK